MRPRPASAAERELRAGLGDGSLPEIEVAWSDPFGHAAGQADPGRQFLDRASGSGFAFCEASLGWNTDGTVIDSLRLTNWDGGYPDVFAVPDLSTFRPLPWRPGSVTSSPTSSRTTAPRRCSTRGRCCSGCWTAWPHWATPPRSGSSSSSICSNPDGSPFQHDIHAYSLENANALDPLITDLYETLGRLHQIGGHPDRVRARPGGDEPGLHRRAGGRRRRARLKYAAKEVARRHGKIASFMPKPFSEHSGSSQHLHISLWRDGEPAFARTTVPRTNWRCMPSPVCSSTCRRSRCSARTR